MTPKDAQARLDQLQSLYRQWLDQKSQLDTLERHLTAALETITALERAYMSDDYHELLALDAKGLLDTTTDGEYSVLSEDTLYNEIIAKEVMLWQLLRLCVQALDRTHSADNTDNLV